MLFGLLGDSTPRYAGACQTPKTPDNQGIVGNLLGGSSTPAYGGTGQPLPNPRSSGLWGCSSPEYRPAPAPAPTPEPAPVPEPAAQPSPEMSEAVTETFPAPVRIIVLEGDTGSRSCMERVLQRLQDYLLDQ